MLLVTFHGGKPPKKSDTPPINNVFAFATGGSNAGKLLSSAALAAPPNTSAALSELRGMEWDGKQLYVVNGSKHSSTVLAYQHAKGHQFDNPKVVISAVAVKGSFTTSIAHPFGLAFRGTDACFVSNQDTNVVALVDLSQTGSNGELGTLHSGSQSKYLNGKHNHEHFLDGTFVASHKGNLDDVTPPDGKKIPNVSKMDGGLTVRFAKPTKKDPALNKPHNSVRDVLVVGDVLYVCDEPEGTINFYAVKDGTYLGQTDVLHDQHDQDDAKSGKDDVAAPTHFALLDDGIWISAGTNLFWMQALPAAKPVQSPVAVLNIRTAAANPKGWKIGGISFKTSGKTTTAYIPLQKATGGGADSGGSIISALVIPGAAGKAPRLDKSTVFASALKDTPEFVLYIHDAKES